MANPEDKFIVQTLDSERCGPGQESCATYPTDRATPKSHATETGWGNGVFPGSVSESKPLPGSWIDAGWFPHIKQFMNKGRDSQWNEK
jgi:hypothetical protein